MILETERLTLSPLTADDATALFALIRDPLVAADWDDDTMNDPDRVDDFVSSKLAAMQVGQAHYWAMRRTRDGALIGCCEISDIDRKTHQAEFGFLIAKSQWNQGYAQEALRAVLAHAAGLHLRLLKARVHVGDARSEALLTMMGFSQRGYLRGEVDKDGERRDARLFAVTL